MSTRTILCKIASGPIPKLVTPKSPKFSRGLLDMSVRGGVTGGAVYGLMKWRGETSSPRKRRKSMQIAAGAAGLAAGGPPLQGALSRGLAKILKVGQFTPVGGLGGIYKLPRAKSVSMTLKPPGQTYGELAGAIRPATTSSMGKMGTASLVSSLRIPKFPSSVTSLRIKPVRPITRGLEKVPGVQAIRGI